MPPNRSRIREALKSFDFAKLFIEELSWDRPPTASIEVAVDGSTYSLRPAAHKRGMVVFLCTAPNSEIPDHATRSKIERQATKSAHEHIIIYTDANQEAQVWQWVRREPGRPTASRQHSFHRSQPGDALVQKLEALAFELSEEEGLTIATVAGRARQAFDVDRVTKRFYDRFKSEHAAFLQFVKGIHSQGDQEWYASVMLNRLMFVYFIQKKGFLDADTDYLRNRLRLMQASKGKDQFHSFYRHFLLRLFHEGLGQDKSVRSSGLDDLLGQVPYLNGGLFDVHQLEREWSSIEIADEAFETVFDFFDSYEWHLDARPLGADNEINPDVLGYIFEKYINQKQMGAYYTKEDITEYIARSTVIPRVLEIAEAGSDRISLSEAIGKLLQEDPDRYIFDDARKGALLELPKEIAAGLEDVSQRQGWNRAAFDDFGLPTETWREHVERRRRYEELRPKLASGGARSVDDLVAYNLDLRQVAQDLIETCEAPRALRAYYTAIRELTVLDPTCGSGAFLFAVLNLLEPLYEACLDRMETFLVAWDRKEGAKPPPEAGEFRSVLQEVAAHPNRRYFILKSIVLNNLFGVDIMEEAVEICKLRLFLKLAAQVESADEIEPLPDIDFNVRAGNALVGFSSYDEVANAIRSKLDFEDALPRINERAELANTSYQQFRDAQTGRGGSNTTVHEVKAELQLRIAEMRHELDRYLATEYGADRDIESWRSTHQPFHWFLDFFGIGKGGGFDVVIGNPPYVEYSKVRGTYTVKNFRTLDCGDLYGLVMERAVNLLKTGGRLGMIVPVSILGAKGFQELRDVLLDNAVCTYTQGFAERPSKLFTGVDKRLAIWVLKKGEGDGHLFAAKYRRWFSEERDQLFTTAVFTEITELPQLVGGALPKVQSKVETDILRKIASGGKPLGQFVLRRGGHVLYYTRKVRYFVQFFLEVPRITNAAGQPVPPTELKELAFASRQARDVAVAALNSNLFFWFFSVYSDVRNVNRREIEYFPINLQLAEENYGAELGELATALTNDFEENSVTATINYGKHGVLTIQTFRPRLSKPIIDRIDQALAQLFGLSPGEADFVINHDVKYRLGADAEEDP